MRTPFCLLFLSEHVRHAYVSAKATVFSSVAVNADIRLPRVGLGSFHPQAQFAPDAASLHAVQVIMLQRVKLCAVPFGVEIFSVYVQIGNVKICLVNKTHKIFNAIKPMLLSATQLPVFCKP